ncbi:MAG: hypothetical protein MUP55_04460, partial [Candidatus Aenigmarchaeota archaeon]|nr:hypothetical protein [Candidatus Aenigmarchaeota archaeon]
MILLIILLLFVVWSSAILGLVAALRKFRISPNRVIIIAFLLFGCAIGAWSFYMGDAEIVAELNLP